jgi:hypothetical protein
VESFFCDYGLFAFGVEFSTNAAYCPVTSASGAMLSTIEDDLQVKTVPVLAREQSLEILFRLLD